jgi:hypothetical protein
VSEPVNSRAWFGTDATMTWPCGHKERFKKGDPFVGLRCPKHDCLESGSVYLSAGWSVVSDPEQKL